MEKREILAALAALAQETRLDVFRRLVRAGREGIAAGRVAADLGIPPATLSFHLKELKAARLVTNEREGRVIRYAPDFAVIGGVVAYLGENCCRDEGGCAPAGVASGRAPSATGSARPGTRARNGKAPARSRKGTRK